MIGPVKNYKQALYPNGDVTQWFGENPKLYAQFGLAGHNGVDIVRAYGEKMFAIEDGTVVEVKFDPNGFGKHLRFISNSKEKGYAREWTYGHCATIYVAVGDKVVAGQHIADMGNTGFVVSGPTPYWKNNPYAGTHLHLGLRLVEIGQGWSYPGSYIKFSVKDYGNGYKGAIDPTPYLSPISEVGQPSLNQLELTVVSLQRTLAKLLALRK